MQGVLYFHMQFLGLPHCDILLFAASAAILMVIENRPKTSHITCSSKALYVITVCIIVLCTCLLAPQAGQLSQELKDKRAERAVARATANAYRQVLRLMLAVYLCAGLMMCTHFVAGVSLIRVVSVITMLNHDVHISGYHQSATQPQL